MRIIGILLLCLFSTYVSAQSTKCPTHSTFEYDDDGTLTLSVGELLEAPSCYKGRLVRVYGFYSNGFEISRLYATPDGKGKTSWLSSQPYYSVVKRCTAPLDLKKLNRDGGTFGVVMLGLINTKAGIDEADIQSDLGSKRISETRGGFGHLNAYNTEFTTMCFERVEQFSKYSIVDDAKLLNKMSKWLANIPDTLP